MTGQGVTVVVPTVDRPDELRRCLVALAEQSVAPAAVVVVDQGGLPGTALLIEEMVSRGLRVRHLRAPLRGVSTARNVGLRAVTTSWVAVTDDDCVPSPDWVESVVRAAASPEAPDVVTGRVLPLEAEGEAVHTLSLRVSTQRRAYHGRVFPWRTGTGGNMALRVETMRRMGGYDERLGPGTPGQAGEDLEVLYRLLASGAVVLFDPDVLVLHNRVTAARRLTSRRSYGFGMGAFVGIWWIADPWVLKALIRWSAERVLSTARAVSRGDLRRVREEWFLTRGLVAGLRYGVRLGPPLRPLRYVAARPGDDG